MSKIYYAFRFLSVSTMDMKRGILSVENFNMAVVKLNRQPKLEFLKGEKTLLGLDLFRLIVFGYFLCSIILYSNFWIFLVFINLPFQSDSNWSTNSVCFVISPSLFCPLYYFFPVKSILCKIV